MLRVGPALETIAFVLVLACTCQFRGSIHTASTLAVQTAAGGS